MAVNKVWKMKRILVMTSLAAIAACGEQDVTPTEGSRTGFALSFFRNVNAVTDPQSNIVVSPYSAGAVLSMLEAGAEGETKVELDNALNGAVYGKEELGGGENTIVESSNAVCTNYEQILSHYYPGTQLQTWDE